MKKTLSLKKIVVVLMTFLLLLSCIRIDVNATEHTTQELGGLFAAKYGKAQIFDVQRSPAYPKENQLCRLSGFGNIYNAISGDNVNWGTNNDRYVQFVDTKTQESNTHRAGYEVSLYLYEADGTVVECLSNYGTVWGLGQDGFFYEGQDHYGYFITNKKGFSYGSRLEYTPNTGLVTVVEDLVNYDGNEEPISTETPKDETPKWNIGYPKTGYITENSVQVLCEINEIGKVYWVCLPKGSTAPSSKNVKDGQDGHKEVVDSEMSGSLDLEANTEGEFAVDGLNAETEYDIYVVAEDEAPNLQTSPKKIQIKTSAPTDATPPEWGELYPRDREITENSAKVSIKINEAGKVYWVCLPKCAAPPSSTNVKYGQDGMGAALAGGMNGNISLKANEERNFNISGLNAETEYDIYVVAEDEVSNIQSDAVKISVNTNCIVSFNVAGGTIVNKQSIIYNGKATKPLANPTKQGYTFGGWYKDISFSTEFDFENTSINESTVIYAKWISDSSSESEAGSGSSEEASESASSGGSSSESSSTTSSVEGKTVNGDVVDNNGKSVKGVEAKVTAETNGTKTIEIKSNEVILLKQPDGTKAPLKDSSKLSFSTEGNAIIIAKDGTIKINNLANSTETKVAVTYDLGNGEKIKVGTMNVKVDKNGNVTFTSTLIDPYGIITDSLTGKSICDASVKLYYGDTARNRALGKVSGTLVKLPIISGFKPNDNRNPQLSDINGEYAFMVFPKTDYEVVVQKEGYDIYKSPIISVEMEIVKHDIKMQLKTKVINYNGWIKNGATWNYYTNGIKATGWVLSENKWYYLNNDGEMITGWVLWDSKWYYLKANGEMSVGWQLINDKWYHLGNNGEMSIGWILSNNEWYYLSSNGDMAINTMVEGYFVGANGEWIR